MSAERVFGVLRQRKLYIAEPAWPGYFYESSVRVAFFIPENFELLSSGACVEIWRVQEKVGIEGRVPERAEAAFY